MVVKYKICNHCVSKALVESNPKHTLFVLEDLSSVRSATERVRRKDRYVSVSWSFYDFEQKLKYKAALKRVPLSMWTLVIQVRLVLFAVTPRSLIATRRSISSVAKPAVIHLMMTALEP